MSTFKLLVVLSLAVILLGCQSMSGSAQTGKVAPVAAPVAVIRDFNGDDAALKFPTVMLIKTQAEFEGLQAKTLAAHPVDFAKESLLVLALGDKPTAGYWAKITAVQSAGDTLFVQGLANEPGKGQLVAQTVTHAYGAAVIAKTSAAKVQSDITSLSGQPMK